MHRPFPRAVWLAAAASILAAATGLVALNSLVRLAGGGATGLLPAWEAVCLLAAGAVLAILARAVLVRDRDVEEVRRSYRAEVTRREAAEAGVRVNTTALAQSEARFRALAGFAPVGIFLTDASGACLYVNDRWSRLAGLSAAQAEGIGWSRAVHEDDRERVVQEWTEATRTRRTFRSDLRFRRPGGEVSWVAASASAILGADGGVEGYAGTVLDITARRVAEESLLESEERLTLVVDASNDGIWDWDLADDTIVWSDRLFEILDLSPRQYQPSRERLPDLVHPDDRARFTEAFRGHLRTGEHFRVEVRLKKGDGRFGHYLVHGMASRDRRGRALRMAGSLSDVTARTQAEAALRERTAELERSNHELEQFAYVASHDLQEPLRMVAGFAALLDREYRDRLDGDAGEYLRRLVDGAERMQALIRDLLVYSRAGRRPEAGLVDAAAAVAEAIRNLHAAIDEAGATMHVGPLPSVVAERRQLAQVFQNLIGNAIKFRGDAPCRVEVSAARDGEAWRFAVADNGIGLDGRHRDRIFALFQRLHGADSYPGTGIGLALCKRVVEGLGGRIWVESEPGRGATFHFTLPAVPVGRAA